MNGKAVIDDSAAIAKLLGAGKRFAVTCHLRPDGDAIGSVVGLHHVLQARGAESCVVGLESVPDRYRFLLDDVTTVEPDAVDISTLDAVIVLDSGNVERAPAFVAELKGKVRCVNIDHHPDNTRFGDLNLVDSSACCVGEILHDLAVDAELDVPLRAAEALWVAMVTDTGRFAFSNTTASALRVGAALVGLGVDTFGIDRKVFHSLSLAELRLQERAIAGLELRCDGRVAAVSLACADLEAVHAGPADLQDIVEIPRSLAGVEVAAFLYETDDKGIKVSLRATAPHDVGVFCRERGGGGHARAAGCTVDGPLATAQPRVLGEIEKTFFSDGGE